MWTRRETVVGGALSLIFTQQSLCSCGAQASMPETAGCYIADQDLNAIYSKGTETRTYIRGDEPIIYSSGDKYFDYALAQTLAMLSRTFEVLPGFAYYDDQRSPNAYATSAVRLARTDGTILFGTELLRRFRGELEYPEVAVAAVCAHEFGHILQFKHALYQKLTAGQPTVKRGELQADYFAGYFAGLRKLARPSYPAAVVAVAMYKLGDSNKTGKDHHGTTKERGAAVVRGFEASFHEGKNLSVAIEESTSYAMHL